jgi:hypothetical protein
MSAINVTSAAELQGYAQEFYDKLKTRMYFGFDSIKVASVIEGVKGRMVLTDLEIGDLVKRASITFQPRPNIIKYRSRVLVTEQVDIDFEINPKVMANSYLEGMRKKGQNGTDIPFEGQVMSGIANKVSSEFENAFWKAEQTTTPAVGDALKKVFNGALKLFKQIRLDGHMPIPVPGGAYNIDNIIPQMDAMFATLTPEAIEFGVEAFASRKNLNLYIAAYKKVNNANMPTVKRNKGNVITAVELNNGVGWLYAPLGFGVSELVIMSQMGNIIWGTDDINDANDFKIKDQIKTIQFTTAARVGMQIWIAEEDYVAINDLM